VKNGVVLSLVSAQNMLVNGQPADVARRSTGLPVEFIHLRKSVDNNVSTSETAYGEIAPRDGGGISVEVPNGGDEIAFTTTGGGQFSKVALAAQTISAVANNGTETIALTPNNGLVRVGANGTEGDLIVLDGSGNLAVTLDGSPAAVIVGGPKNNGAVRVLDGGRADAVRLEGGPGDVLFRGSLRDINAPGIGVTNTQLHHLTQGETIDPYNLHWHNAGNAALPFAVAYIFAPGDSNRNPSQGTQDVNLGQPTSIFAWTALCGLDPEENYDDDDGSIADIFLVDGQHNPFESFSGGGGGSKYGNPGDDSNIFAPFFIGVAQKLTFRVRNMNGCGAFAVLTVYTQR
jgi:hypothetical protein